MNRIENAVTTSVSEVTALELDSAAVPVATPWAVAGVAVGAAALGYQVGYNLGSTLEDELDSELSTPAQLKSGVSSDELLSTRSAIVTM